MNSAEILDRLKLYLKAKNDKELGDMLGIHKSTLSAWKTRNSFDFPLILEKCPEIDLNWLIKGETCKSKSSELEELKKIETEIQKEHSEINSLSREIRDIRNEKELLAENLKLKDALVKLILQKT